MRPFRIVLSLFLWFGNDRQTMLRAQSVADFPNCPVGVFVIVELVGTVQRRAVELDVTVDMMPVRMGRNNN